jgi:hypothetical protein
MPTNPAHVRHALTRVLIHSNIESLYDPNCNFWEHPREMAEMAKAATNDCVVRALVQTMILRHCPFVRGDEGITDAVLGLIGVPEARQPYHIVDDHQLREMCLSLRQAEGFARLLQFGRSRAQTLDEFERHGYDEIATARALRALNS